MDSIIFIVLGILGLNIIIILILALVIKHIIDKYIGIDRSIRFFKFLGVIVVFEVIVSFFIALLAVYDAVPYLAQFPNGGFHESFWIVFICALTILTLLTVLLALVYHIGYQRGFGLAQALMQASEDNEYSY